MAKSTNARNSGKRGAPQGRRSAGAAKAAARERARRQAELKRKGSWAVLFGGAAVVVAIIAFSILSSINNSNAGVASVNDWELPSLYDGDDITLASLRGKPVVLNFFASWCTACEDELPEFVAAAEQFGDQVEFVFVDSQDSNGPGREMAERFGLDPSRVVRDFGANNQAMHRALGGRGMPITAFYDADGTLREVSQGALVSGRLLAALSELGYI